MKVAWIAPPNPGYTGPFTANERFKGIETLPIAGNHGPEDVALDAEGRFYAAALSAFFDPILSPVERMVARVEGWILGIK